MVHSGILPHHPRWAKLFENLRYVIIDELHAYRGVFGSHLCNVLRRLRRICRHYGSDPVFLCSSATIQNPRELAERLTEQPFELVDKSGAPRGEKFFVFVNPPVVNQQLGIRRSYLAETRRVASEFLKRNLQLIVFAQSRLSTEILTTYLKDDFEGIPGAPEKIRGYRGGYLPMRRREIEKGLREGAVRAVVSTNALELGIDIGALDVSVMAGYPGTIAATWQRAGRAGRRSGRSAAVMVAQQRAARSVRRPQPVVLLRRVARARADRSRQPAHPRRPHQVRGVRAAVHADETFGRHRMIQVPCLRATADARRFSASLRSRGWCTAPTKRPPWTWTNESYPADAVSLRSVSSDNFVIVDITSETRVIGETDFTSGPSTLHPKAIYIVEGQLFQVERLDFEGRKAFVRSIDCDYYTTAISYAKVTPIDTFASRDASRVARRGARRVARGRLQEDQVLHERERRLGRARSARAADAHDVVLADDSVASVMGALPYASDDRRDGVVGLAFALKQVAQLLLMCDGHDIGISINSGRPTESRRDRARNDLRLRQLSRRHRLQRAAVRGARGAARGHTAADCRVPVRERLPGVRRADRQHRSARQGRGASHPRLARAGTDDTEGTEDTEADRWRGRGGRRGGRAVLSALADRIRGIVGRAHARRESARIRPSRAPSALPDLAARRSAAVARWLLRRRPPLGAHQRARPRARSVRWPRRSSTARGEVAAVHRRRAGAAAVRVLRPRDDRPQRRRRHARVPRRLRVVRGGWRVRDAAVPAHAARRRAPLLDAVAAELARAGALVSFNGKSFDAAAARRTVPVPPHRLARSRDAARRRPPSGAAVLEIARRQLRRIALQRARRNGLARRPSRAPRPRVRSRRSRNSSSGFAAGATCRGSRFRRGISSSCAAATPVRSKRSSSTTGSTC